MQTNSATDLPPVAKAFNGKDRNACRKTPFTVVLQVFATQPYLRF